MAGGSSPAQARSGDLDPTFGTNGVVVQNFSDESEADRVVIQKDGKIVVGGLLSGATFELGVVRYRPDGTLDATFGSGGLVHTAIGHSVYFSDLALDSSGRILVAGTSYDGHGGHGFAVVRYDGSGQPDSSFGDSGIVLTGIGRESDALALAVGGDGGIFVAGSSRSGNGRLITVAKILDDGTLDPAFGQAGIAQFGDPSEVTRANGMALQADGRIVLIGSWQGASGLNQLTVVRLTSSGAADTSFGTSGAVRTPIDEDSYGLATVAQRDGKIVVAAYSGVYSSDPQRCSLTVARYQSDGSLDPTWGNHGLAARPADCSFFAIHDVTMTSTGKVIVPGSSDFTAERFGLDGTLDGTFGDGGTVALLDVRDLGVVSVAVQSDGRLVVAGGANAPGPAVKFAFAIARLEGDPARQSRSQATPDGRQILVSKDVSGQRWAIARDVDSGTVTGNIYPAAGGEPHFVWCEESSAGAEPTEIKLSCFGADPCLTGPCGPGDWSALGQVSIAKSFFQPSGETPWAPIADPVILPASFFAPPTAPALPGRDSGIQLTKDEAGVLINKAVGDQRWAILQTIADGSVTGNVFDQSGAVDFLWCAPSKTDGGSGSLTFSCSLAAAADQP